MLSAANKEPNQSINQSIICPLAQIVELSLRLIVMWSVPFNLNLYDTYLGLAMIYNQVTVQPHQNLEIQKLS